MVEKVVAINLLRRRSSLPEVYAVFIPFLKNSTGKRFSSTRIRLLEKVGGTGTALNPRV